ncbi:SGNH/GDSL hydrolase family protein [Nocardia sp. SYP-A9097]|uniref:SGNH/GDSL hydrolase family protein n=1 Tax=Nocardia sp. SYP-A9097 TaxID=2663237 RepID=UPI00129BE6A9|nr:SGNH/GDSL hydrolase family protein [Nocardia sp. SYP-A9097]MRH86874.1 SGNH/GDSL hydrolase family protein [Nocardia sp. SYP-A9097]
MASEQSFTRFVALGDSQTEGVGDPDGSGGLRGWADRFAGKLAAANPGVLYANLAIRGRRTARIRAEQLEAALALRPDLVALIAGMNDLIRPRFDQAGTLADIEAMLAALTEAGARVVSFTFPDIGSVAPFVRPLSGRVRAMNAEMRVLAAKYDVTLVDFEPVSTTTDRRAWAEDRLHLSPLGHEIVAQAVADSLAIPGADASWRDPLPPLLSQQQPLERVATELRWVADHFVPWVGRRVRGRSSGDFVLPKRPQLTTVSQFT